MGTGCGKDKQTNLRFDPRFYKSSIFNIREDELLTLWSAEKIVLVLKGKQLVNQVIVRASNLLIQTAP